jgi:hypothetical protein
MTQEDFGYYQLKELIRDEMREQSPDLAKIMAKYKAITADKDAEIAALQMQIRVEGAANGKELAALKAEIEWLRTGIQEAIDESDKEIGDGDTIAEIFNELARFLADAPPQPREEAQPVSDPHWEGNDPVCPECGEEKNLHYQEQYANGEHWKCNVCTREFMHQPVSE